MELETEGRDEALDTDLGVEGGEGTPDSGQDNEPADKRLADTQRAFHESREEAKALRDRLAKMEGMMEVMAAAPKATPADQPDPFAEVDDEAFWSDIYDDPKKLQRLTKKQIEVFGSTILADRKAREAAEQRIEKMERSLAELREGVNKPDPATAAKIEQLRQDPDFKGVPDDVLAKIAKKLPVPSGYGGGPPSGGRVSVKAGGDAHARHLSPEAKKRYEQALKEFKGA